MAPDVVDSLAVKNLQIGIYANASLPALPEGSLAYDITNHKLMIRVAAAWETVTSA